MKHPYLKTLLLCLCLFASINAFAQAVEIDDVYYYLDYHAKVATVTSRPNNEKYKGTVFIPKYVSDEGVVYYVMDIGNYAFSGCYNLTSVYIGENVQVIGHRAFYGCEGLTSVTIPNSVTSIECSVFAGCSGLTSVTIPNSVTSIGDDAFHGCFSLTSVTIPNSVTSIGEDTFYYCYGLKKVIVSDIAAWCSIEFGYDYANPLSYARHLYSDETTEITSLIIPDSVTNIRNYAFSGCSGLTSVTIPNSVTSIGDHAFGRCSGLTSVTIPNSVTSIGDHAFYRCEGLTSVTIPNSVTSIGDGAFSGCEGLTSVTIPNSVTSIGDLAFHGCSSLTSVTIPNSVTSIQSYAFESCSRLTSVNIGNGVKSIGEQAFAYCKELTDVYCYAENVPTTESDAFYYTENATLHVPAASVEQYKATEPWSNFGTIVPLTDEDAIAEVQAVPVLIQTQGNTITVEGTEAGTEIILYGVNGVQLDSVIATTGTASLNASGLSGSVAIVKIGDKTVKVLIKQ